MEVACNSFVPAGYPCIPRLVADQVGSIFAITMTMQWQPFTGVFPVSIGYILKGGTVRCSAHQLCHAYFNENAQFSFPRRRGGFRSHHHHTGVSLSSQLDQHWRSFPGHLCAGQFLRIAEMVYFFSYVSWPFRVPLLPFVYFLWIIFNWITFFFSNHYGEFCVCKIASPISVTHFPSLPLTSVMLSLAIK